METHDVIVAGGGPSGLMAAWKAAEGDADVLLIEKEDLLGGKVCGEALSQQTILDAGLPLSESFISNKIDGVYVYAPDEGRRVKITEQEAGMEGGYIVDKSQFLQALAEVSVFKGVALRLNTKVLDVVQDNSQVRVRVEGKEGAKEIRSKILIGCDGAASVVARKFFSRENYELIACMQYTLSNCSIDDERFCEFYLGEKVAPLGYAWIFPKGDGLANVGVGVRGKPARPYLDRFVDRHAEKFRNSMVVKVGAAPVPISGLIKELVSDNLMLCGDACGQVIPLTGAGIHSGIAAGKMAGEVAAAAVKENNFSGSRLAEYAKRYEDDWGKRIRNSLKALRIISRLSDMELNQLADVIGGQDILDLANGLNLRRVAQRLLRHPVFAVKVARFLLG
ncbi:geranylgeranyl reductase family protein [Chloroflexota bacterium]